MLAGWHHLKQSTYGNPLLHEVGMTIMSNQECAAVVSQLQGLHEAQSALYLRPGKWGSRSALQRRLRRPLVGCKWASFIWQSDCEKGLPAVFERVTRYLEWVHYRTLLQVTKL
nr:unnamed protein product [Callosobruchus chinensis]